MRRILLIVQTILLSSAMLFAAEQKPLYVVDGEVASLEEVEKIPSDDIESMSIVRDDENILAEWSAKGNVSNGIVFIETKSGRDSLVFITAETMPKFMDGDVQSFQMWVMQNIRYPEEALSKGLEGKVVVQFVVGKDGYIDTDRLEFFDKCSPLLHDEVVRVFEKAPRWTPAIQKGEAVAISYVIPVVFAIAQDEEVKNVEPSDEPQTDNNIVVMSLGSNDVTSASAPPMVVDARSMQVLRINDVEPTHIKGVTLYKTDEAAKKFSSLGDTSNGVMLVDFHDNTSVTATPTTTFAIIGDYRPFITFMRSNLRYPSAAEKQQVQGVVAYEFTTDRSGAIDVSSIKTTSPHKPLNDEVRRVIAKSPSMNISSGEVAPMRMSGLVIFTLPYLKEGVFEANGEEVGKIRAAHPSTVADIIVAGFGN